MRRVTFLLQMWIHTEIFGTFIKSVDSLNFVLFFMLLARD
jgi:hypothetical protein